MTAAVSTFDADDPAATLTNLVEHASLARAGIAFELLIVLTQTAAAAWFYRLFRHRRVRPGQRPTRSAGSSSPAASVTCSARSPQSSPRTRGPSPTRSPTRRRSASSG
ncbi:DUF4386 domain-containing protein [Rhizomonospora bruguierae]|uniref:DUF4386 domain-containing protein n=1 Tax=Rhizomonospora bruguierae TaxID=1581705 RepID=UPI0024BEB877|nr:DUF4386 domain-containing protein [Micromonospora sp. NBRC 107566]